MSNIEFEDFGEMKEIAGFKYRYFVTSRGVIFSMSTGQMRQLKPAKRGSTRNQYPFVVLIGIDKKVNSPVHRLVAEHFLPPKPTEKHVINHKDGNKLNNDVSNLEWTTVSGNTRHAYRNGLAGGVKHGSFKGPVCTSRGDGFGYVFFGFNQAVELGFRYSLVAKCLSNKQRSHAGHTFQRMTLIQDNHKFRSIRAGEVSNLRRRERNRG